nr:adenylate/guanylate cyclase domain-containing protein [Cellvibrionaceae bacterium]
MSIQRCYAVILFTDLCSSTSLCEKIDAEFYAEIIAQIRKIAEHAIGRNKGLLNQFHGDGILAAFGFPKPAEDAIHNATTAALELHREVRNAQRHYKLPKNFQLKMHSGIDAGYIVADTGDRIQGQYKFAGNALNTAARLSDLAEQDEIIVSVDTLRHELPFFVTERLNNVKLKGKQKCISVYKIKGSSKIKNRFQAREHMGLTPFMGRPKELRRLADALLSSKNGRLNHINIIGDAGLGKSRLVKHFLSLNHCSNCNIYQTFCVENRPFFSIYQLLSDIFSIEAGTPAKDIRHNTVAKLKQLNLNSAAACKQLVKMHSLDFESDMENRDLRCFITKHLASILGVLAEEKPIIVLIDDCHLGDRQLFQNLALLFQQLQKSRILIITCNRPGIKSKLPSMGETLLLSPLKAAKGKNLIHRLLPQNCSEKTTH